MTKDWNVEIEVIVGKFTDPSDQACVSLVDLVFENELRIMYIMIHSHSMRARPHMLSTNLDSYTIGVAPCGARVRTDICTSWT